MQNGNGRKFYFSTTDMFKDFLGDVYDDIFGREYMKRKMVDTEKYDIIEKVEYKKERLKTEIERAKQSASHSERMIDVHAKQKEQYEKEVERLSEELKELE